jgi:cell wall-associated NlpC family hydrolase
MIGVRFIKRKPKKQPLSDKVTVEAHKYLGNRYHYGSVPRTYKSPSDCSGLVVAVYGAVGYNLPRTAAQQARIGVEVDVGKMQPGDLVFYRNKRGRIGHVGIYIGNANFIHASSTNRCVVKAPLRGRIAKVVRVKES